MKELTQTEVMEVSGAGIVSDAGKVLGSGFGALIDAGASIFGIKPNASTTIGKIGESIGSAFDAGISGVKQFFGLSAPQQ